MRYSVSSVLAAVVVVGLAEAELEKRQTISQLPSCPGVVNAQSSSTVCCVGGSLSLAPLNLSSCPGWPICTGPVTITPSSTPRNPPLTCATVIDVNNPSYSSLLAAATSSIAASGTRAITTINPTGPAASPGSSGSGSTTATPTGSSGGSTSATASAATTSKNAAVGISGSALGGIGVAGIAGMINLLL